MNAIMVIHPYKYEGMWVFDDDRVGLEREPFVAGADTIIDQMVADIPNAASGFSLVFAAQPFPGYQFKFDRQREEYGGHWYRIAELNMEGWLCPALFKYFEDAPDKIYAQCKHRS
ncbi:MAG: DUF6717 family protein [Cyanobacteria bacterium J06648_16]